MHARSVGRGFRILVTAAGGSPALGFTRSLKAAPEDYHLIGVDANQYTLQRSEADERYLVPKVSHPRYFDVLREIIEETRPDFLHVQMSEEMLAISGNRESLGTRTLLPRHETVVICEDKFKSFEVWRRAGIAVPETVILNGPEDLRKAFDSFGPKLWVRAISGSAGRGSLPTDDFDTARLWIDFHKGWGEFSAAECLQQQTITWQSIWKDGKLVVAQGRKRLYWEFANRSPSGVTGITGTGVTVSDPALDELAIRCITTIDPAPDGIYGVDLTYDKHGVPNPTEINSGRFFTTHQFFTAAGLNMPHIFIKTAFSEPVDIPRRINPLPDGLAWIRGMDCLPRLTTVAEVDAAQAELRARIARHGHA